MQYQVGDLIRLKKQWMDCKLPLGAVATICSVHLAGDTFRVKFQVPVMDKYYGPNSLFGGLSTWWERADGPW